MTRPTPGTPARPTADLGALRRACAPVARWWEDHLRGGDADPDALEAALGPTRALGPVPGRLGAALAYLVAGCPDLDYPSACAAFTHVAAVGRGGTPPPPPATAAHQLSLPGLGAGARTLPPRHLARPAPTTPAPGPAPSTTCHTTPDEKGPPQ